MIMQHDDYSHNIILPLSHLLRKLKVHKINNVCAATAWLVIGLRAIYINIQNTSLPDYDA